MISVEERKRLNQLPFRKAMLEGNVSQTRKSIDPLPVKSDGRYTSPRTWGVYKVERLLEGKRFHFGNHPIRQQELIRQYGEAQLVGGLYEERINAKEAAFLLNGGRHNAKELQIGKLVSTSNVRA
jgi:hypothetical protein